MLSPFMALAAVEAEKHIGATSPNPPVGACLVKDGQVLAIGAHTCAGRDHAEIVALKQAMALYGAEAVRGSTLYVTLEPCNHYGKTPPCTAAILEAGIKHVVYGIADPNKKAAGGAATLKAAGLEVEVSGDQKLCLELVRPFFKWLRTGKPWVVHKIAYRSTTEIKGATLTMIPAAGQTTFTSADSLKRAHLERRKSDAILTSLGTVLADAPSFNVRHLPDHEGKRRCIAVVSRDGRSAPASWTERQQTLGHDVLFFDSVESALCELGKRGAHRVLVEAGPALSVVIASKNLWDERLLFIANGEGQADHVSLDLSDLSEEYPCSPEL